VDKYVKPHIFEGSNLRFTDRRKALFNCKNRVEKPNDFEVNNGNKTRLKKEL